MHGDRGSSYSAQALPFCVEQSPGTVYGQQRYVTSSPPYNDFEGNEFAGFLFVKLNKKGEPVNSYFAQDPSWAYNGPTQTRCDFQDPRTKKKYRLKRTPSKGHAKTIDCILKDGKKPFKPDERLFEEKYNEQLIREKIKALKGITDNAALQEASVNFDRYEAQNIYNRILREEYEEITEAIKHADMPLIPHPFVDQDDHTVVLLDYRDDKLRDMIDLQVQMAQEGGDAKILDAIHQGYFKFEDDALDGHMEIPGVKHIRLKKK